ncbi:MAG: ABC-F family ATP-binding cassette domain-containing protein [Deltaproteobacteria bacterium]|nr:ABC-F family ATP-binding cassette domain-containing protein [Deltaproteobacteria bacterium]
MLKMSDLSKSYGGQTLFDRVNLQMNPGERLGLVGRNGHGKSTLFRIILGEEEADRGNVIIPRGYRVGHLEQHLKFTEATVIEEACLGLQPDEAHLQYKAEKILFGLGFTEGDLYMSPESFSGGFQIRINLTKVLVSEPNLLLLDEPTNYLDIVSIRWMTKFLRAWRGELILISHDRDFMDSVTTHTAMIHRKQLRKLAGNTEKLYAQVLQDEEIYEKTRQNEEKKRKHEEAFIERFRAKASKAAAVQSRIKRLEKMPSLEKLAHLEELDFTFREAPFEADQLLRVDHLSFHYDPELPLIQNLNFQLKKGDRVAIIGKNGRGKSTLLNLIAEEMKPIEGEVQMHPSVQMGYFGQTNIQRLHVQNTIEQEIAQENANLTRTQVRNICATMMFSGDLCEKKISVLSGGERSRVLLGKILAHPSNLLLLDEPTNHLDMESIEALLESLAEFEGGVLIVTHSEMILKDLANRLIIFDRGKVEVFDGSYDEFLDRIGWQEEEGNSQTIQKKSAQNKKEIRKVRSEIVSERSKILSPLKKEIDQLESQIGIWEKDLSQLNQKITDASSQNQGHQIVELSKAIKIQEEKIQQAYLRFTELEEKYAYLSKEFDAKLSEISGEEND